MKSLMAPLAAGVAAGALLYGLLWAAERRLPEPEDPWVDAFIAEGMKAEFRSLSTEPQSQVLPGDLRPLFEGPAFAGTVVRNYQVQNTSVQVVRLPSTGLIPEVAEVPASPSRDPRHRPPGALAASLEKLLRRDGVAAMPQQDRPRPARSGTRSSAAAENRGK